MVLLNCQLHWSVNLVIMSVLSLSKLGLNYTPLLVDKIGSQDVAGKGMHNLM